MNRRRFPLYRPPPIPSSMSRPSTARRAPCLFTSSSVRTRSLPRIRSSKCANTSKAVAVPELMASQSPVMTRERKTPAPPLRPVASCPLRSLSSLCTCCCTILGRRALQRRTRRISRTDRTALVECGTDPFLKEPNFIAPRSIYSSIKLIDIHLANFTTSCCYSPSFLSSIVFPVLQSQKVVVVRNPKAPRPKYGSGMDQRGFP